MRIAICFSGQPRFVEECSPYILSNIIEPNRRIGNVDVFVHTWFDDEMTKKPLYTNEVSSFSGGAKISKKAIEQIESIYKPKSIVVDNPLSVNKFSDDVFDGFIKFYIDGKNDFGMEVSEFKKIKIESSYSMMYSLFMSNFIKRKYELRNGFFYDYVFKVRFDSIPTKELSLDPFNKQIVYFEDLKKPTHEVCDWFFFGNSKNMDVISSIYLEFETLAKYSTNLYGGWSNESLIKSICDLRSIPYENFRFGTKLPRWGVI